MHHHPATSASCKAAAILAIGLCLGLFTAGPASALAAAEAPSSSASGGRAADFQGAAASADARRMADWVVATGDNRAMPFVIVDKKATEVFVFDARGRILGATSALLGLARGDDTAPGVGDRKLADIRPDERTTPAGRFVASLGRDLGPQDVLWVDYGSALALHRVLAANSREHRLERLAAPSPLDRRITFGCINVPAAFYDSVVHPAFTGTSGVVYILPEVKTMAEVFPSANL
ncbi:MAG: L,D-transpeptidase [Caulobacteraceae bacterium]